MSWADSLPGMKGWPFAPEPKEAIKLAAMSQASEKLTG